MSKIPQPPKRLIVVIVPLGGIQWAPRAKFIHVQLPSSILHTVTRLDFNILSTPKKQFHKMNYFPFSKANASPIPINIE